MSTNEQVRWRWVTRKVDVKEAARRRLEMRKCLRARIKEIQDELAELDARPLRLEARVMEAVHPGEPGYEQADILMDPAGYGGEFRWVDGGFVPKGAADSSCSSVITDPQSPASQEPPP